MSEEIKQASPTGGATPMSRRRRVGIGVGGGVAVAAGLVGSFLLGAASGAVPAIAADAGPAWVQSSNVLFDTPVDSAGFPSMYPGVRLYADGTAPGYREDHVSVADGAMEIRVEVVDGVAVGAAGTFARPDDGDSATDERDFVGGAFELEFQVVPISNDVGNTSAALVGFVAQMWPSPTPGLCQFGYDGKPPSDGRGGCWEKIELDHPEVFNGDENIVRTFSHGSGARAPSNVLAKETAADLRQWHTARTEWITGAEGRPASVRYFLDGKPVGEVTDPADVPTEAHRWVIQAGPGSKDALPPVGGLVRINRATSFTLAG